MSSQDFESLTRAALDEAVAEHIAPVASSGDRTDSLTAVAVIGFSGDDVRGSLGVAASDLGLDRIASACGVDADDALGRLDSLGELANLILGQVKRRWDRRGVHATISTPQTLRGLSIEVCGQLSASGAGGTDAESGWLEVEHGAGADRVQVWLDFHCLADVELSEESGGDAVAEQGDAILF